MVAAKGGLSPQDLSDLVEALGAGKRVTVYLREPVAGLGLEAGASARVVSVDGSTVTVRPRGVDDDLPYEADELRRTRNEPAARAATARAATARTVSARRKAPAVSNPEAAKPQAGEPEAGEPQAAKPAAPKPLAQDAEPPKPAPAKSAAAKPAVQKPSAPKPAAAEAALELFGAGAAVEAAVEVRKPAEPAPASRRPARARTASGTGPQVKVVVSGSIDGGWTVSVERGKQSGGPAGAVSPGAVLRAVRELGHEPAFLAVQESLAAAREAAARRIAELTRELEEAKAVFDSLG